MNKKGVFLIIDNPKKLLTLTKRIGKTKITNVATISPNKKAFSFINKIRSFIFITLMENQNCV